MFKCCRILWYLTQRGHDPLHSSDEGADFVTTSHSSSSATWCFSLCYGIKEWSQWTEWPARIRVFSFKYKNNCCTKWKWKQFNSSWILKEFWTHPSLYWLSWPNQRQYLYSIMFTYPEIHTEMLSGESFCSHLFSHILPFCCYHERCASRLWLEAKNSRQLLSLGRIWWG